MKKTAFVTVAAMLLTMIANVITPMWAFAETDTAVWQSSSAIGGTGENITGYYVGNRETTVYYNPSTKKLASGDIYYYKLSESLTEEETPVSITVDYYDKGTGSFLIEYQKFSFNPEVKITDTTKTVNCTDTNTWKNITFNLDKPFFNGALEFSKNNISYNADFNIKNNSETEDIFIGKVTVNKTEDYPMTAVFKNNVAYNIYSVDNQNLCIEYANSKNDKSTANISARVYNDEEKTVWERNEEISLAAKEKKIREYCPDITVFGKYTFEITVTADNYSRTESVPFAVINSAAGIKNERMNINQEFDFNLDERFGEYEDKAEIIKNAGFGALRGSIAWEYVEWEKGVLSIPENRRFNLYITPEDLEKDDFYLLFGLEFGNKYYNPEAYGKNVTTFPYGEEAVDAFVNYARFIAEEYKKRAPGRIKYYALWNEFNGGDFNKGNATSKQYAEMLKRVYPAIKEVDPDAEVIAFCATANLPEKVLIYYYDFVEEVLKEGGYNYFDAISYHPYCYIGDRHIRKGTELRELLEKYRPEGAPQKEFYYTECGYPTNIISEKGQADYLVKMYAEALGNNLGTKFWWYDLMNKNDVGKEYERNYGLVLNYKFGGYAKYAYIAAAGLNKFMYDADFEKKLTEQSGVSAYGFKKKNNEDIAVLWSNDTTKRTTQLNLNADVIDIYDVFTNHIDQMQSQNGIYNIEVTDSPIYVKKSFAAVSDNEQISLIASGKESCYSGEEPIYTYKLLNKGKKVKGNLTAYTTVQGENKILYSESIIIPKETELSGSMTLKNPGAGFHTITFEFIPDNSDGEISVSFGRELTVSEKFSADRYSVNCTNDTLTAEIYTLPNTATAVYVSDKSGNIVYIDQGYSDENGKSVISGYFPYKGIFSIKIYTGRTLQNRSIEVDGNNISYEIKRKNTVTGDMEIVTVNDLQDGDDIILSVNYNGSAKGNGVSMYSTVYSSGNAVNNVQKKSIESGGQAEFELHIDKADSLNKWKLYLWDENMVPLEETVILLNK